MGSFITITSTDGFELQAYRAAAEGPSRGAVVVVQEIFGVNSHIRSVVDRYAAAGYEAIAPAIFDRAEPNVELGYGPDDMTAGMTIARSKLQFPLVLADVTAAGKAVGSAGKVGVVGYCFGGLVAAACAVNAADTFSAAVSYYGGGTVGIVGNGVPAIPLMMHFGERDAHIPLSDVDTIKTAWADADVSLYEADHGFNCDQREAFSAVPAAIAQARTFRFFDTHLG